MLKLSNELLNIIVAFSKENMYISYKNKFPWGRLKYDLLFLRYIMNLDSDVVLIGGRKTIEIGKFNGYKKIMLTSKKIDPHPEIQTAHSFTEAIKLAKNKKCLIIGGENVYRHALNYPFQLFCTIIENSHLHGDVIFPATLLPNHPNLYYLNPSLLKNITFDLSLVLNFNNSLSIDSDGFFILENGFKYRFYLYSSLNPPSSSNLFPSKNINK
ncbi:MAG: dihydrofolate reductase [Tissierellia bacterium]|nr:dihydrofolate reductase [Tissierellia bacterium]